MSDYHQFLLEREKIDFYIQQGYQIKKVIENLSGAFVEFEHREGLNKESKVEELHILTADARKYFSALLIKQRKNR